MAGPVSSPAIHVSDLLKVSAAMADKPRYYLTTAIAYPNGAPHVGFAYELIATDAIARFKRLDGYDVYFLTGTDEHGIKMLQTAAKEHITPQQLTARTVPRFRAHRRAHELLERRLHPHHGGAPPSLLGSDLAADGGERRHLSRQVFGLVLGARRSLLRRGRDALDEKGVRIGPQGTPVEWVEEESYFFRLSAYQQKLHRSLREAAGLRAAEGAPERGLELRAAAACRTSRSRARRSTGAFRCLGPTRRAVHAPPMPSMSCMCGSTR